MTLASNGMHMAADRVGRGLNVVCTTVVWKRHWDFGPFPEGTRTFFYRPFFPLTTTICKRLEENVRRVRYLMFSNRRNPNNFLDGKYNAHLSSLFKTLM